MLYPALRRMDQMSAAMLEITAANPISIAASMIIIRPLLCHEKDFHLFGTL